MEKLTEAIVRLMLYILMFIFGYVVGCDKTNDELSKKIIIDTTYNTITLDSIQYNIIKKDSMIKIIKREMTNEIDKAINADDSTVIEQFKHLASSE